jgi:hypothetical protein
MWPRFRVQTRLSTETASRRLAALLERRRSPEGDGDYDEVFRKPWTRSGHDALFTGWIEEGEFRLKRAAWQANAFRPIAFGRIEKTTHGCVIEAVMRPALPVVIFSAMWLGTLLFTAILMFYDAFASWNWTWLPAGLTAIAAFVAISWFVAALTFIPEQRKTERMLRIALGHRRRSRD